MFITGLGTAAPANCYTQAECWEALRASKPFSSLSLRSRTILKKVLLGHNGIMTRHLVLNPLSEAFDLNPDVLHARFTEHAPVLATAAAQRALEQSGNQAAEIDALLVSTCTGYLCPGLCSYVMERLGLAPDLLALDLVGHGCGAALPNLRTAAALLESRGYQRVLSICVEVCSAAFYLDDDPGVLVSTCLFGDGAAAAVLAREPNPRQRRVQWRLSRSTFSATDRDLLRFEQKNGMLRNVLSLQVPRLAAQHAETVLHQALEASQLKPDEITGWILHAGGRDVLAALQEKLGLTPDDIRWSSKVLRDFGNVSSPFVLLVLQAALKNNAPGGFWWLSSFGAGFSCHGALLEVEAAQTR